MSACVCYINIAKDILKGIDLREAIKNSVSKNSSFDFLLDLDNLSIDEICSDSFVVNSLKASLWCLVTTDNYKGCVLKAVNLGSDTDTTAAIAGGLAGILYSYDNIPKDWIEKLKCKEIIEGCLF